MLNEFGCGFSFASASCGCTKKKLVRCVYLNFDGD